MEEPLVLRTVGAKPLLSLSVLLFAAFTAFFAWSLFDGRFALIPLLGALSSVLLMVRGTAGSKVTVAEGALSFLHGLRRRRIPVQDVAELFVHDPRSGLRRVFVVLPDGKRLPLPAPGAWWPFRNPGIAEEVAVLSNALGLNPHGKRRAPE
jgi:hypothetical protein